MTQYRISKYDSYQRLGYCAECRAWYTFWRWVPVRDNLGDVIVESKDQIKHLIKCWTDKPLIIPLNMRKRK